MNPQEAQAAIERLYTVVSNFFYNAGPGVDIRDQGLTSQVMLDAEQAIADLALSTERQADEEEREAFAALGTLLAALNDLRSTETSDLPIPGPAEQWRKSLDAGEQAYGELESMMQEWQEELGDHYHRGVNANEDLDDTYEDSEEE